MAYKSVENVPYFSQITIKIWIELLIQSPINPILMWTKWAIAERKFVKVDDMQNDFMMTVRQLPAKLNAKGKQDKSELIKHIFAKASSIQDRLGQL